MPEEFHLEGQIEFGEDSQGLHAQLYLKTPWIRASKVMKTFPKIHVEVARNRIALKNYVHKEETRVGDFKTIEARAPPQWNQIILLFADWVREYFPNIPDDPPEERKYFLWDEFIRDKIMEGMKIDIIGVNPQYRSCVQKYWTAYMYLSANKPPPLDNADRQTTDKQDVSPPPVENNFSDIIIPTCPELPSPEPVVPLPVARKRLVRRVLLAE